MLDASTALLVVKSHLPNGKIQKYIDYKNLFVFQVFGEDPLEGTMDPFFSVHKTTVEFNGFSIFTDGDTAEIVALFKEAKPLVEKEVT